MKPSACRDRSEFDESHTPVHEPGTVPLTDVTEDVNDLELPDEEVVDAD